MDKYRCERCTKIEKFVHMCGDQHLVCELCVNAMASAEAAALHCSCGSPLLDLQRNPLDTLIEMVAGDNKCPHSECTAAPPNIGELAKHISQCPFRPHRCLGTALQIWTCDWTGRQADLVHHLATAHPELGPMLTPADHTAADRIPFDAAQTMGTLTLIGAFDRQFVFFYYTKACTRTVNFIVFLVGDRRAASRFSVVLQLSSADTAGHERVEFETPCRSDDADIHATIDAEECIVLSHRAARKYLDADGCLRFRVQIRDKEAKVVPPVVTKAVANEVPSEQPPKAQNPVPPKVMKKGAVVANLTKKSTAAVGSSCSTGGLAPLASRVPAIGSPMIKIVTPTVQIQAQQHQQVHVFNQPSVQQQQHLTNPATHSPGSSGIGSGGPFAFSAPATHQPMYRPQPYKAIDEKFYTLKYPNTSIQKPVYKK